MTHPARRLLALDTATEACSVALYVAGEITSRYNVAPRGHAQNILPMIEDLLTEAELTLAQLDAIAFGRGPGSFTGLRIAAGVVQGLAYAVDLPVVPVSTLATLAQAAETDTVLAAIDARMNEVYWGQYRRDQDGVMQLEGEEVVCPPDRITCPDAGEWWGIGTGWQTHGEVMQSLCGERIVQTEPDALPHAANMIPIALQAFRHGRVVPPEQAIPIYLRDQVVQKPPTEKT